MTPLTVLGFERAGINFWYNPSCEWDHAHVVLSIADGSSDSILDLKRHGKTELLFVGPNVYTAIGYESSKPVVDSWVVPSYWVGDYNNVVRNEEWDYFAWPVGVDEFYWKPTHSAKRNRTRTPRVLFYLKTNPLPSEHLAQAYEIVTNLGFEVKTVRYGSYSPEEFKAHLDVSFAMVVFSHTESQGVFLFEAWSMNVPTFVYASDGFQHDYAGISWLSHPAPYLTPVCGWMFSKPAQLTNLLMKGFNYHPRRWVLRHGTAKRSGEMFRDEVLRRLKLKCATEATPSPSLSPTDDIGVRASVSPTTASAST